MPDRDPAAGSSPSTPPRPHSGAVPPLLLVLAIVAGGYAFLFLAAITAQVPVRLIDYQDLGSDDFSVFWSAANDVLAGRNPYLRPRFVTPPLSWLPYLALAPLPRPQAVSAFFCLDVVALVAGAGTLARFCRLREPPALAFALVCILSPATLMLLDRSNLDGLVFLGLCLFFTRRADGTAGSLALAAATCLKLYPVVFIPALVAQRRRKAALLAAGFVAATVVLMPSDDLAFLHGQVVRAGGMRVDGNLSALATFWVIDRLLPDGPAGLAAHPAMLTGAILYAVALGTCLWHDARLIGRVGRPDAVLLLASYAGFCVGMPSLVYLYSGVCLFLPLAALGQEGLSVSPARLRDLALALGFTMLPAFSIHLTLGAGWPSAFNVLPFAGSLLFIVAAVGLRLDLRRRTVAREAADGRPAASAEAPSGLGWAIADPR